MFEKESSAYIVDDRENYSNLSDDTLVDPERTGRISDYVLENILHRYSKPKPSIVEKRLREMSSENINPKNCQEYDNYDYRRSREMTEEERTLSNQKAERAKRWAEEKLGIVFGSEDKCMDNSKVSLDFIDEGLRDKITVKVGTDPGLYGGFCAEVFLDVTSFIHNLPEIIERVEVKLDDACDVSECEFDDYEKKRIVRKIKEILSNEDALSKGRISADAATAIITLNGGVQICGWNSEWGGVSILLPGQSDCK